MNICLPMQEGDIRDTGWSDSGRSPGKGKTTHSNDILENPKGQRSLAGSWFIGSQGVDMKPAAQHLSVNVLQESHAQCLGGGGRGDPLDASMGPRGGGRRRDGWGFYPRGPRLGQGCVLMVFSSREQCERTPEDRGRASHRREECMTAGRGCGLCKGYKGTRPWSSEEHIQVKERHPELTLVCR